MPKGWTIRFFRGRGVWVICYRHEEFHEGVGFLFDQSLNCPFPTLYIEAKPGREKRELIIRIRGGSRIFLRRGCTTKEWRH